MPHPRRRQPQAGKVVFSFFIPLPQPTSFAHLVTRITQSSHGAFYRYKNERIGRVLWVNGCPRFVEIGQSDFQDNQLEVRVYNGNASDEGAVASLIRHLFSLEMDLGSFYRHAEHDLKLYTLVTKLKGARMIRDADLFSSVISTIISQQINLKYAAELKRRLWSLAGEPIAVDGEVFYADPTPDSIAQLDYGKLRQLQYSTRKAEYVIDFARAVQSQALDLTYLSELDDDHFINTLSSLRGLGRWTAECVLLFGLGRPNLLPAKDVGLQKAVSILWGLESRVSEDDLRKIGTAWQPFCSWYTYYLWLSLA